MSDFLTNLAARSVGRAATIQPRLPSLFEPLADAASTSVELPHDPHSEESRDSRTAMIFPISHSEEASPAQRSRSQPAPHASLAGTIERPPLFEEIAIGLSRNTAPVPLQSQVIKRRENTVSRAKPLKPAIPAQILSQPVKSKMAPTIQVTIGRIEVRAVQQSEATPRPAKREKPQPRLTLDEYLLQRRQGKR
jgi:hypothetical protein